MGKIGVFIERYTINRSAEMGALMRLSQVAPRLGHQIDYLFRTDLYKIPQYDAIFIRALTDPLNLSYVVSRTAELHGIRVIDDSNSIYICCDKVNMYRHLVSAGVPIPKTIIIKGKDVTRETGEKILKSLGNPAVLKAPNSSFSAYVEKVKSPKEFVEVGKRFLRRADDIVAQRFIRSEFDWRVGVLGGEPLYVCQYLIPRRRWKVLTYTQSGGFIAGAIKGIEMNKVNPRLLDLAVQACAPIGNGLYGVDIKQVGDEFVVIEVNDNPTMSAGEEDQKAPHIYERVIRYLMREWG